jgi:hypothetical protein
MTTIPGVYSFMDDHAILAGIDWCIDQKDNFSPPITVMNLSLGSVDATNDPAICDNAGGALGALGAAANEAADAGIVVFAASGNENQKAGIINPACASKVIGVGAVYSQDFGQLVHPLPQGGSCTDSAAQASPDEVICFSNTSSILDVMASGYSITGVATYGGGTGPAPVSWTG